MIDKFSTIKQKVASGFSRNQCAAADIVWCIFKLMNTFVAF